MFCLADDLLFAGMMSQHLARRVSLIENKAVRYRAGAFTSPYLLLENFVHTFRDLLPFQLRDRRQNSQDGATHWGVGVNLLGDRHQMLAATDKHIFDEHDQVPHPASSKYRLMRCC